MIKALIIFGIGFIYGVSFTVYCLAEAEKPKADKKPTVKSVSIPYSIPSFAERATAEKYVDQILMEYIENGYSLSVKDYNTIFGFKQDNPLHAMCGWRGAEKLNVQIQIVNGKYNIVMPSMVSMR